MSSLSAAFSGRGNSRSTWSSRPWSQWWPQTGGWRRQCQLKWWGWEERKKRTKAFHTLIIWSCSSPSFFLIKLLLKGLRQIWLWCEAFHSDTLLRDWPWNHIPANDIHPASLCLSLPNSITSSSQWSNKALRFSSASATHWSDLPSGLISCRLSARYWMVMDGFQGCGGKLPCCSLWGTSLLSPALSRSFTGDSGIKRHWKRE